MGNKALSGLNSTIKEEGNKTGGLVSHNSVIKTDIEKGSK